MHVRLDTPEALMTRDSVDRVAVLLSIEVAWNTYPSTPFRYVLLPVLRRTVHLSLADNK